MIFNESYTSDGVNMNSIKESPYTLGLEGALMHVYENECNYNAIMKSVGIAEANYMTENGKDLFVHEAGAFGSFLTKIKDFFKKMIEKIKQMFKKFVSIIDQYIMDDKKFVKKYGDAVLRKDLTDFEFDGYTFDGLDTYNSTLGDRFKVEDIEASIQQIATARDNNSKYLYDADGMNQPRVADKDADATNDRKELWYAKIAGESGSMDESDMRDKIKEKCYGEDGKTTLEIGTTEIRKYLDNITNAKKSITDAERTQKNITNKIDKLIKTLDSVIKKINTTRPASKNDEPTVSADNNTIKLIGQDIDVAKAAGNAATEAYGIIIGALKDRNRQSKAICVKALSYKHEGARYGSGSYYAESTDDLFAGVSIL